MSDKYREMADEFMDRLGCIDTEEVEILIKQIARDAMEDAAVICDDSSGLNKMATLLAKDIRAAKGEI